MNTSKKFFVLSIVVFVIGIVTSIWLLFNMNSQIKNDLTHLVIPNENKITFKEKGTYTIFYEHRSVIDNNTYLNNEELLGTFEINVIHKETRKPLKIATSNATTTYSVNGREGSSLVQFDVDEPGEYLVNVKSDFISEEEPIVLAFSDGTLIKDIVLGILGILAIGGLSVALIIIFIILGLSKQKKAL